MKKSIFILLSIIMSIGAAQAQNTVEVEMYNFKNDKGAVMVGLYNDEATFLDKSFKKSRAGISNRKATVIFTNIPDGTYAIALYHDENNNKKFDTFLGIPTEEYGVSNNAKGTLSKPDWEDVKFEVKGETVVQLIEI